MTPPAAEEHLRAVRQQGVEVAVVRPAHAGMGEQRLALPRVQVVAEPVGDDDRAAAVEERGADALPAPR